MYRSDTRTGKPLPTDEPLAPTRRSDGERLTLFHLRSRMPNIGNDLLAIGMETEIRSVLGDNVNLVSLSAMVNGGGEDAGLTARSVYQINQLADGVIVGPGNLFENGSLTVDLDALACLSVPIMLFSVSMGAVFDRTGRLAARTDSLPARAIAGLCRAARPVLVRDEATRLYLAGLGDESARTVGCPTLLLSPPTFALPPPDPSLADVVLLSIRNPALMSVPYGVQGRVAPDIRAIIDHFRASGRDVRLLCHDYRDLPFAHTFPGVATMYTEDAARFVGWLRSCRLSITFRLHAFVCCLALGKCSVCLSYDQRGRSLIETLGMAEWSIDFVHSKSVLADVVHRCGMPERFHELRLRARPTWDRLRAAMADGVGEFAQHVKDHVDCRAF